MKIWQFIIGLVLASLVIIFPVTQWQSSSLDSLQNLAVQLDGRKKPLDTVARETVTKIHGRTNYTTLSGEKLDYLSTYLSLWLNDRDWNQEPFILFSYQPLKVNLGLDAEQKYFSFAELIASPLNQFLMQVKQKQAQNLDLTRDEREGLTLETRLALMIDTVGQNNLAIAPHPTDIKGKWLGINQAQTYYSSAQIAPLITEYQNIKQTYQYEPNKLDSLGMMADNLKQQLRALSPNIYPTDRALAREVNFYRLHPFAKAWILYAIAFVLMLLALRWFDLYWSAMGIFVGGILIQSYGFFERMSIAHRPPVTNMYESVIWVGFGMAAFALIFELIYRAKYYLLTAAPLAIACLVLADSLPAVLDASIQPLVPVLRDNFWLSVHVPTITLSYASFGLAMGLGHVILGHYLFAPAMKTRIAYLSKLNYRVIQVGVLLLTTGIILGGIWAHFSWGRFWGWDPKETWALIALMCYLVPLHGRLVGWLSDLGMAVVSVICFNAVLMAWYGVNFVLGTGLHSYGFSTGGSELIVASLVLIDLLFVLTTTIRYKNWLSTATSSLIEAEASG